MNLCKKKSMMLDSTYQVCSVWGEQREWHNGKIRPSYISWGVYSQEGLGKTAINQRQLRWWTVCEVFIIPGHGVLVWRILRLKDTCKKWSRWHHLDDIYLLSCCTQIVNNVCIGSVEEPPELLHQTLAGGESMVGATENGRGSTEERELDGLHTHL